MLARTFGCVRLVYNHFLEEKIKVYKETSQSLKYGDCCRMLTQLKRLEDTAWLSEVEAAALQQSLRDLDRAFKNFFTQKWVGFPKFKKKMARKIYRTTYGKIIDESHVWIPKVGLSLIHI